MGFFYNEDDVSKFANEHSENDDHAGIWGMVKNPLEIGKHSMSMEHKKRQAKKEQLDREGRDPTWWEKLDYQVPKQINESFNDETRAYMAPRFNTQGKSPSFMPQDENSPAVLGRRVSADYEGMENSPEIMEKNQAQQGLIP